MAIIVQVTSEALKMTGLKSYDSTFKNVMHFECSRMTNISQGCINKMTVVLKGECGLFCFPDTQTEVHGTGW